METTVTNQATPATPHKPLARTAASAGSDTEQPVIIVGPYGCGKTRLARVIAAYLGKSNMVACWLIGDAVPADTALFSSDTFLAGYTNYHGPHTANGVQIMQFDDVLAALSRDIPSSEPKQVPAPVSTNQKIYKINKSMFAALCLVDAEIEIKGELSERTIDLARSILATVVEEGVA